MKERSEEPPACCPSFWIIPSDMKLTTLYRPDGSCGIPELDLVVQKRPSDQHSSALWCKHSIISFSLFYMHSTSSVATFIEPKML